MTLRAGTRVAGTQPGNSIMRRLLLVSAVLVVALPASAAVRYVGGGFGFGPAFGPWGYGDPYYYGASTLVAHSDAGQIKLDTKVKGAEVFVNGSYAGTAGDLKSMWLRQGSYNLEVRSPGRARYTEKIYVVNGKTLHVRPDLPVEPKL